MYYHFEAGRLASSLHSEFRTWKLEILGSDGKEISERRAFGRLGVFEEPLERYERQEYWELFGTSRDESGLGFVGWLTDAILDVVMGLL